MTDATLPLTTADGKPLKAALAASLAVRRRRALLLVAPLFLFIFLTLWLIPETKNVSLEHIERNLMKGRKLREIGAHD